MHQKPGTQISAKLARLLSVAYRFDSTMSSGQNRNLGFDLSYSIKSHQMARRITMHYILVDQQMPNLYPHVNAYERPTHVTPALQGRHVC